MNLQFPLTIPTQQDFRALVREIVNEVTQEPEWIYFSELADEFNVSSQTIGKKVSAANLPTKYGTKGKMIRSKDKHKVR